MAKKGKDRPRKKQERVAAFQPEFIEDLRYWVETDRKVALRAFDLIEAVMRVHEDEQSPFYGMIAFGLKDEKGFLDAAAMRGKVI